MSGDEVRDEVRLTNLDQPLFDGSQVTKRDLVDYLDAVTDELARFLRELAAGQAEAAETLSAESAEASAESAAGAESADADASGPVMVIVVKSAQDLDTLRDLVPPDRILSSHRHAFALPDDAEVCACAGVTAGRLRGCPDLATAVVRTRATTGCGGCTDVVEELVATPL